MKAFKVHNAEEVKQEVNLPAGTYTYSFRVIPVGTSYTFKLDNQSFTFEGLTAGVLNKRMKHTFELTEAVSFFYLSNTIGDCVYEPQIEEGVFATTPGAHSLDFERLISEAGIEIDHEALSLYAKKADVSAEIKIQTDRIDSTVGSISNDVDEVKGDMTIISQTVNSITSTVTDNTDKIAAIDVKVDEISLTVYDENTGLSAISQTVNSISSTVYDEHGALLSQISQDGENILIQASKIKLEGLVTAYDNFKILEDGSIEAKNGKFTGEINATSGSFTGTIDALEGYIGGLTIEDGKLYVGNINGNRIELDPYNRRIRLVNNDAQLMGEISFASGDTQYDIGAIIEMNHFYQGLKRSSVRLGGVMSDVTIRSYNTSGAKIGETNYRDDGMYVDGQKIAMGGNTYTHPSYHPADMITAGTFPGIVKANNNTSYTTKQVRNMILSTGDAVASSMANGDIWIKYE